MGIKQLRLSRTHKICNIEGLRVNLFHPMKIVRFAIGNKVEYGVLNGKDIQCIKDKPYRRIEMKDQFYSLDEVRLLAPCTPSKIVALGLNYYHHAEELEVAVPNAPLVFLKPSTEMIGNEDNIAYPSSSHQVDYEGELGVVIKKPVWRVSVEDALDYVLGYTCFNDVTAHDLQYSDAQGTKAESFDTFAAVGPCIETELDPASVVIETFLNGKRKQHGNTSDLIYPVAQLINFISHVMPLLSGDIIATGTPSGVGPMAPGDTVEVWIKPIGTLRNSVVSNG